VSEKLIVRESLGLDGREPWKRPGSESRVSSQEKVPESREILQYKLISTSEMDSANIQYSQAHPISRGTLERTQHPAYLQRQGLRPTMPTPCLYRALTDGRKPVIAGDDEHHNGKMRAGNHLSFSGRIHNGLARQVDSAQFQPRQSRTCG
jgi:hypothetical protein